MTIAQISAPASELITFTMPELASVQFVIEEVDAELYPELAGTYRWLMVDSTGDFVDASDLCYSRAEAVESANDQAEWLQCNYWPY